MNNLIIYDKNYVHAIFIKLESQIYEFDKKIIIIIKYTDIKIYSFLLSKNLNVIGFYLVRISIYINIF